MKHRLCAVLAAAAAHGGGSAGVSAPLTDMLRECQLPMDAFF